MTGGFEHGIILPDGYGASAILTQQAFHTNAFGDNIGGYFIQRHFLPDHVLVGMIINLQHFYLFFYLAAKLTHHIFRFCDHNIEAVNALHF